MSIFIIRSCPNCNASPHESEKIAGMRLDLLLQSNPGYNLDWFKSSPIPFEHEFTIVKCIRCGFIFSFERLNDELNFEYYNHGINHDKSLNKVYNSGKRAQLANLWSILLDLESRAKRADQTCLKVVDFGAGWGDFLAMAKCYGTKVYGLEYDEEKIKFAKNQGLNIGDISFLFKNGPYDIFFCNQVLEHLNDPRGALMQLRSLLQPGSVGFISVPCYGAQQIDDEISLLRNHNLPSKDFDPLGHLNYFSPESFHNMLLDHGFAPVDRSNTRFRKINASNRSKLKLLARQLINRYKLLHSLTNQFMTPQYSSTSAFVTAI